tara:strand:- start:94 stop:291 length:198 start_codon:yes stop_codon:yes gene_type:complete
MKKIPKDVAGKIYSYQKRIDKAEFLLLDIKNFLRQIKRMHGLYDSYKLDNFIKTITKFIRRDDDS